MEKTLFQIKNLSFSYGSNALFNDISFKIQEGDFFLFLGPSGSGKTTLLNILTGKIQLNEGQYFSMVPHDYSISILQNLSGMDYLTVDDFLSINFNDYFYDSKKNFNDEKDNFLNYLDLFQCKKKTVSHLSSGERQKLALIDSLLSCPDIFIADELFTYMDEKNKIITYEVLKYFQQKKNLTIILAEHDHNFLKTTSSRFIFLQEGKIYKEGKSCFI